MDDKALYLAQQTRTVEPTDGKYDEMSFWSEAEPGSVEHVPKAAGADETEGNRKWRAQLEKAFWVFLTRPPSEAEVTLLAAHFSMTRSPMEGWYELLYILFMSEEFWHI